MPTRFLFHLALCLASACGDDDAVGDAGGMDASMADGGPVDVGGADVPGEADAGADASSDAGAQDAGCRGWCEAPALPEPLQEIAVIAFGDAYVVVGGYDGDGNVETTVHLFRPGEGFESLPSLPDARHHTGLCAHEGSLYALGGMRDSSFAPLRRSFVLAPGADRWEEIAPLPSPRASGIAGTLGDFLVYAGGIGEGRTTDERLEAATPAYIYDPAADTWRVGASLPTPRDHAAGFVRDGELWVLGGRRISLEPTLDVVEIYDLEADAWRSGAPMPGARGGHAAAFLDGRAYVSGGEERGDALSSVDVFSFESSEWTEGLEMGSPRHGHGMAVAGGRIYAVGGADRPVFAAIDGVEVLVP